MHLADEMLDHLLRDLEIRDHAVAHGTDRLDIAGRPAQHHLGVVADRANMLFATPRHGGDDGGLVQDDSPPLHVDQRICGPEVDGHIARQYAEKIAEHAFPALPFQRGACIPCPAGDGAGGRRRSPHFHRETVNASGTCFSRFTKSLLSAFT